MTAGSNSDARKREAERAEQAATGSKSALGAPNSPEAGSDASGAAGAILTSEQRATLRLAIRQALVTAWRDEYSVRTIVNGIAAELDDAIAAIVREHRAEVLAEVEARIEAWALWQDHENSNIERGFAFGVTHAVGIIRDYGQEQDHG